MLGRNGKHATCKAAKHYYDTATGILNRILKIGGREHEHTYVPVIPTRLRERYLALFHNTAMAGHSGFDKTLAIMTTRVYNWKGMGKDLKAWIAACIPCRQKKSHSLHTRVGRMGHVLVQEPFQTWSMDIVGPLPRTKDYGNDHIITFIDHFTNFPVAVAVSGTRLGISKLQTTAFNPACNGKNEKLHLYLQTAMHAFVNQKHTDWDRYLNSALMAYRVAPLARIGFSPAYLALGIRCCVCSKGPNQGRCGTVPFQSD